MLKVHDNIYIGRVRFFTIGLVKYDDAAILNVSSWYHYILNDWTKGFKYQNHSNYLTMEGENMLSINWVDADARFFNWQGKGVETFIKCLDFIEQHYKERKVYIVCDKAISRSPSVALLYLAKRLHVLPDTSFEEAREKFLLLYPMYNPGGIKDFISEHWEEIK